MGRSEQPPAKNGSGRAGGNPGPFHAIAKRALRNTGSGFQAAIVRAHSRASAMSAPREQAAQLDRGR
jgi:hypothetical protein